MALALSLVYFLLAHWMVVKIHDKIRVSGELSSI